MAGDLQVRSHVVEQHIERATKLIRLSFEEESRFRSLEKSAQKRKRRKNLLLKKKEKRKGLRHKKEGALFAGPCTPRWTTCLASGAVPRLRSRPSPSTTTTGAPLSWSSEVFTSTLRVSACVPCFSCSIIPCFVATTGRTSRRSFTKSQIEGRRGEARRGEAAD